MASRYPEHKVLDFCQSPIVISKNGDSYLVPCGHCNGCLLHSSNLWSQRLAMEIEHSNYSIFFTLTYNNEFLPKLKIRPDEVIKGVQKYSYFPIWSNVRVAPRISPTGYVTSIDVVRRNDHIFIDGEDYFSVPITNFVPDRPFSASEFLPYPSKRDIQLWLKNVRKSLNNHFYGEKPSFRYYIISELGGEKYRPHYHGIIFCEKFEWSEFLKEYALYACWQMCDKSLFDQHTKYCNSATARYLTEYVTVPSDLPRIYKQPSTKNFRLVSKSPAIGFCSFTKNEVQEKISVGDITYDRKIQRLGQSFVLRYPSNFVSSVFPKCRGFSRMSFDRLLSVYGYLYKEIYERGRSYSSLYRRLSTIDSVTFNAQRSCLRYCESLGFNAIFHYCFMLDNCYYLLEMSRLSSWYRWQEKQDNLYVILASYNNLSDYITYYYERNFVLDVLFSISSLSIPFLDQLPDSISSLSVSEFLFRVQSSRSFIYSESYDLECSDILSDACKMRNYNELVGLQPHIV